MAPQDAKRERRRARRRSAAVGRAAAIVLPALCCAVAAGAPSPRPVTLERIVRRLGPEAFGLKAPAGRIEVVQVNDQAREVVASPARVSIAHERGVLFRSGVARLPVKLPPEVASFPDSSFELSLIYVPFEIELDDKTLDGFETKGRFKRRESAWRLERDAKDPAAGTLVIEPEPEPETEKGKGQRRHLGQLILRLDALGPVPASLESEPFDLPRNGVLELGYAATPQAAGGTAPLAFRAALDCGVGEPLVLHEDRVDTKAAGFARWRDAAVSLPTTAKPCRLELEAKRDGAPVTAGAAWAIPRVLAPVPGAAARDDWNIVLIDLDTLRADHLSGYGYARETSPHIDAELIAKGASFLDVSTSFPRTDVSHLSLFTSLWAAAQPTQGRLAAEHPVKTLAEAVRDAGMETAAFTENALVGGPFGFWFGYDEFTEHAYETDVRGKAVFADGIRWVREHSDRRFFLFLHTYKVHDPWVYADEYAKLFTSADDWKQLDARIPADQRANVDAYDRTIREADDMVGELLAELERTGLAARTLVVLFSDHGEAFGEHKILSHGLAYHQEQLRIPLVLRGPGIRAGMRTDVPASIVDVAPTLLDLIGASPLPLGQGTSLRPVLEGGTLPEDRPLYFKWLNPNGSGVRYGRWKFIRNDVGHELFDLEKDPKESEPQRKGPARPQDAGLLDRHGRESSALRDSLLESSHEGDAAPPIVNDRMQKALEALGYVE